MVTRRIGVLAVQGNFAQHEAALAELGFDTKLVREPHQLAGLDGLVLPGGESTTQLELIDSAKLAPALERFAAAGRPILCTCAGLILAARKVERPKQSSFGWLDVVVSRNGWGPQIHSFESPDDGGALSLILIRAPRIVTTGARVEVLATLGGEPVLVRQERVIGATFHPELTSDRAVHRLAFH